MGGGSWTAQDYSGYTASRGLKTKSNGTISRDYDVKELYQSNSLKDELNPKKSMRECCDSTEHPNTIPVILALDVTGSMGNAAKEIATQLNSIMTNVFNKVQDVEFLIMGIGDMMCDNVPVQASQFESDIRIAEQLEKVYFEFGGGGNGSESYTAAWYFGLTHTKLDCWNRDKKGIIITIGDEPINPYLPKRRIENVFGDSSELDIDTSRLYESASKKYDIYHIAISDTTTYRYYDTEIKSSFGEYLDDEHLIISSCENLPGTIFDIISKSSVVKEEKFENNSDELISW